MRLPEVLRIAHYVVEAMRHRLLNTQYVITQIMKI